MGLFCVIWIRHECDISETEGAYKGVELSRLEERWSYPFKRKQLLHLMDRWQSAWASSDLQNNIDTDD
jgi:hypothetical protein